MENLTPAGSLPYPRLLIRHLNDVLSKHDVWQIESMQISHVQLLGTSEEFRTFASFVQKFQTLQTVLFSDAITSQQQPCGFDAILMALSNCSQLKEVSLQNMSSISPSAIGQLVRSDHLIKLQILLSPSSAINGVTGAMISPLVQHLSMPSSSLQELRIFGMLNPNACNVLSHMLVKNTSLRRVALKLRLENLTTAAPTTCHQQSITRFSFESRQNYNNLPLLSALESPGCSLRSLELYLLGSRTDLEYYIFHFGQALKCNKSLKHLQLVLYPAHDATASATFLRATSIALMSRPDQMDPQQAFLENIQDKLSKALCHNYVLHHLTINHGLVEVVPCSKMYLKLNRAGRGELLTTSRPHTRAQELERWMTTLERVTSDVSCIYYLLSCHPTLFCGCETHHDSSFAGDVTQLLQLPLKRKMDLGPPSNKAAT